MTKVNKNKGSAKKDKIKESEQPLVSVVVLAYNAQATISQAIESVLSQETDFPFEILVGDDASTDATPLILQKYAKEYPKKIKYFQNMSNVGTTENAFNLFKEAKGKYLASCEGDDFWTDVKKLQKQVTFLEENPRFSACAHNAKIIDCYGREHKSQKLFWIRKKRIFTQRDFKGIFLPEQVGTLVRRNIFSKDDKNLEFYKSAHKFIGDRTVVMLLLLQGPIYSMPDTMSCYRYSKVSEAGITQRKFKYPDNIRNELSYTIELCKYARKVSPNNRFNFNYYKKMLLAMACYCAIKFRENKDKTLVKDILETLPCKSLATLSIPFKAITKAVSMMYSNKRLETKGNLQTNTKPSVSSNQWTKTKKEKKISIGVLCDNDARHIPSCLGAIEREAEGLDAEIIIIDNGSIDQSDYVIKKVLENDKFERVRVYELEYKASIANVYRLLKSLGVGEYFIFLKMSDLWTKPGFLKEMVRFLDKNKNYSAVGATFQIKVERNKGATCFDEARNVLYSEAGVFSKEEFNAGKLPTHPSFMLCRNKIRTECISKVDFPFEWALTLELLQYGNIRVLDFSAGLVRYEREDISYSDFYAYYSNKALYVIHQSYPKVERYVKHLDVELDVKKAQERLWIDAGTSGIKNRKKIVYDNSLSIYVEQSRKKRKRYKELIAKEILGGKARQRMREYQKNARNFKRTDNQNEELQKTERVLATFGGVNYKEKSLEIPGFPSTRPMVSIGMTVYNQERYIGQALDSILMQEVDFDYEIVIAEDCSTDRSREIVIDYAQRYPDKIKLVLQEHNVGVQEQSRQLRVICKGKYRTHLEGDDFWLTKDKLQKQIDFLENNPDYIAVTGKIKCVNEKNMGCAFPYGRLTDIYCFRSEYFMEDFKNWLLPSHTGALLYRNLYYDLPDDKRKMYEDYAIVGDRKTALFLISQGRIHCLPETISVRRIELTNEKNFTANLRKLKPYAMTCNWMCELENFAVDMFNLNIDMTNSIKKQYDYSINTFCKNPSKYALKQVVLISKMFGDARENRRYFFQKAIKILKWARKYYGKKEFMGRLFGMVGAFSKSFVKRRKDLKERQKILKGTSLDKIKATKANKDKEKQKKEM